MADLDLGHARRRAYIFLPFGLGFLLGPLLTPRAGRIFASFVNPIRVGLELLGLCPTLLREYSEAAA